MQINYINAKKEAFGKVINQQIAESIPVNRFHYKLTVSY